MKYSLILAGVTVICVWALWAQGSGQLQMEETSANFSETQKAELRGIVMKAGFLVNHDYPALSEYVRGEVTAKYASFWNVVVFSRSDYNYRFYLTGTYDSTHLNKRYFQVLDTQPYGFSILILETNNTVSGLPSASAPVVPVSSPSLSVSPSTPALQYTKTKSPTVTTQQEAGIDLAITTAYTWNKDIINFSKVLQRLTQTNLNEHWEVLTSYQSMSNFGFHYTSPFDQWVEYKEYGLGSTNWHVYLWKNYNAG